MNLREKLRNPDYVPSPQEVYEFATAQLRYRTRAAWTQWKDLPVDAQLAWEWGYIRVWSRMQQEEREGKETLLLSSGGGV